MIFANLFKPLSFSLVSLLIQNSRRELEIQKNWNRRRKEAWRFSPPIPSEK
jgi:hypothetical protein